MRWRPGATGSKRRLQRNRAEPVLFSGAGRLPFYFQKKASPQTFPSPLFVHTKKTSLANEKTSGGDTTLRRVPRQHDPIMDFVMHNKESMYRFAYSYVLHPDDALDVVQDSIHKALTADKLREESAIKSWFYKIIAHTSVDFLRRKKKVTVVDDVTIQLHDPGQHDFYKDLDLEKALNDLPLEYRGVIVLRYFEDLKIGEVAEVLDLNVNTVKTRLYKGLGRLREILNDVDGGRD